MSIGGFHDGMCLRGLGGGLSGMEQYDLQLVQMRNPLLGGVAQ